MAVSIIFIWGIDQAGVQLVTNYLCLSSNLLNLIFIVKEKCDSSVNDHVRVVLVSRFSYDFFPVYQFRTCLSEMDKEFFFPPLFSSHSIRVFRLCFRKQKIREGYHDNFALMTENSTEDNKSFDRSKYMTRNFVVLFKVLISIIWQCQ